MKTNPFALIWYNSKMTQKQVEKNNMRYWKWEIKYNGFVPPNSKK